MSIIRVRPANDRRTAHGVIFQAIVQLLAPEWNVALTGYDSHHVSGEITTASGKRFALTLTEIIREDR